MKLEELATHLADRGRVGMTDVLAEKLGIVSAEVMRGRLMAQVEVDRAHLGVYLLGVYVVDDTDLWGDGEIYWWSVPAMVDADGSVTRSPLHGLPTGGPPHRVGSLEWMTNFSLKDPPLLAVIPPEERVAACTLRLGFYDDDGKPADVAGAIGKGLEALAALPKDGLQGADALVSPVRSAIFNSLKAQEDDILFDQDITIRKGGLVAFGSGTIGSAMTAKARLYYFVRDEERTEQFGPVVLHKGQVETVSFEHPLKGGGRLAIFARGADVACSAYGDITNDMPFLNRVVDSNQEAALAGGFTVTGSGPSKLVAFYTPP